MAHTLAPTHCPDRDTWSGFYAGKADPEQLTGLAAHLDSCRACQDVLGSFGDDTGDRTDALVAGLRGVGPGEDEFEVEAECRQALARVKALVPGVPAAPPVRERLGEYRVEQLLGRGGMGEVYRATHARLGRAVALKVVPPERARDAVAQARFHREMAALGKLDHPNVVRATHPGEADGGTFLGLDLVDGLDLGQLVKTCGPLRVADACELARQAAAGLQHLTAHGLVHRDVKPSNLMLDRRGTVKILDLGLAASGELGDEGKALTGPGMVVGTFDYVAPEQADPTSRVDARADVYGLGCTLFFLLTAKPPYGGAALASPRSKILAHTAGPVPEVRESRPEVPKELSAVLAKMLAKNPSGRYATPAAAAAALAPHCAGHDLARVLTSAGFEPLPPEAAPASHPAATRHRKSYFLAAAVALLLVGGGIAAINHWVLPRDNASSPPPKQDDPAPAEKPAPTPVYPIALLGFEERGAKDAAAKVTDLLFAKLAAKPDLVLVDRTDLKKILDEQQLNLTGAVKTDEAVKVGQLTGAKILVTGSVIQVEKKLILAAKIIGTETGRVIGALAEGVISDDLGTLTGKLADAVAEKVSKDIEKIVPKPTPPVDRLAALNKKLGKGAKPVVYVQVGERHVGQPTVDPAAQTEVMRFARETGFEVVDPDDGGKSKADVYLTGEGFSEVAGRVGGLVSVRARVELKAVDRRSGKVLAVDRQTVLVVDLSEQVAGKAALQAAAADLAERLLPKLVVKK
jgi:serine/threonine protein kinase/TolB-like protein